MFRIRPNGCTRRHMKKGERDGPCLRKSRGDPQYLQLVYTKQRYVEFEDLERILSGIKQKERKS